ncbi:MAG: hypothetical protein ACE5OZ_09415 [Candidatus Heimdallarchaeota archaeon]
MLKRQLIPLAVLCLLVGSGMVAILPTGASTPTTTREISTEIFEMTPLAPIPDSDTSDLDVMAEDPKGSLWHVWLDHPHYLYVPNTMIVNIHIENLGDVTDFVNWTLWVNTTQRANAPLWVNAGTDHVSTYDLTADGTFAWDKGPGYYELLLEVDHNGERYEAWSWFVVRDAELEVWLVQDYYIEENDSMSMEVHIANNGTMAKDVNWSLWVNNTKRVGYTDFQVDAKFENTTFVPLTANLTYPWYKGVGYYDVYLNVSYYGKLYEAWCWFIVREKKMDLEVWIEQEYFFYSGALFTLELHMNNSGPGDWVNVTLEINDVLNRSLTNAWLPGWGDNVTFPILYADFSSSWYSGSGYYYVELNVSRNGELYQAWCYFYIDSSDELYVSIIQDYYYDVGESVEFKMNITNMTPSSDWINATMTVWNALTGYFTFYVDSGIWITSYEEWTDSAWWTFDAPGYYEIYLDVYNVTSGWWYGADCWVVIRDFSHDIWIDQPYYAELHEQANFELWFEYDSIPLTMNSLNVTLWANDTVIYQDLALDLSGTASWYIPTQYSFTQAGYYDIWLRVYNNTGFLWYEVWCYIWVAELEIDLWIEQDYYFGENDLAWVNLYVEMPYNDFFYDDLNVTLLADGSKIFNGLYPFDGASNTFLIGAISESYIFVDRIFLAPGYHDIELLVEYQGQFWSAWCYIWKEGYIEGEGGFELWIDQETTSTVGEEQWMTFNIRSNFTHDMPAVTVKISIDGPPGTTILYNNPSVSIDAGSWWKHSLSYVFSESGAWAVNLLLIDDIGVEWHAYCDWQVYEEGETDAFVGINAPDFVKVDEPFEVDAKIFAGAFGDLFVYNATLAYVDGKQIAFESIDDTIPAGTSRQYSFTVTISDLGGYVFQITVETNKGLLEEHFDIEVVEELPESSGSKDSESDVPTTTTPGFEILILVLAGGVLLGLRRRR